MGAYRNSALLVDGGWISADERDCVAIENPATGEDVGSCPIATTGDIAAALSAGERAFPRWSTRPATERAEILHRAAELVRERADAIAALLTMEQGKLPDEAAVEVRGAANHIDWMAEEGRRAYGRIVPARGPGLRQMVLCEPIGTVAAFSPWNFPATTPAKKLSASLVAGCCCILKAAEETPLTAVEIVKAFIEAGVPQGVIGLLTGRPAEISERLIASPVVRKISFTGSVPVGRELAALAAAHGKPATLELGGHAPVLVFADADLDRTARLSVAAKFRNAGQVCVSPTRFLVDAAVCPSFIDRFVAETGKLAAAPQGEGMGPLASARRLEAVEEIVADAVAAGARVLCGGARTGNAGYGFAPTVLTDVPPTARLLQEEPFGPIAIIQPFSSESEAVARANDTPYGLAAYAFTEDGGRRARLGHGLQAGLVGINSFQINAPETPWGGVKDSGYGREAGSEGLAAYLTEKTVVEAFEPVPQQ